MDLLGGEPHRVVVRAVRGALGAHGDVDALLGAVEQERPDVILTDIAMPGEDGYWLLSEIRHHAAGGVSGLPVVAATAYGRDHSRARVLAAGFLDHLPKPVDPDVLCRAIAAAVGR